MVLRLQKASFQMSPIRSLPGIEDCHNRPLSIIYPILFIDAIHYSVRDNSAIRKLAAYIILGINLDGKKEILSIRCW